MASHYNCSVPADTRPRPPGVEPAVAPALAASQYNTRPIVEGNHGVADKPVVPLLAPLRRLREVERPLDLKHRLAKRVTPDGKAKPAAHIHPAMLEETMPKDLQKRLSRRLVEGNKRYSYLQQDWNLLFQQTMELPSEQPHQRILKVQKLIQIHSEFVTVAEVLGRQIIEELNLPPEKRTITPEQGIGEAGGTKYILAGCFFKLQKDVRGLYGGEKYAMKATSAELRNMKAIYESGMEGLCMPLVAMIDYRGYRLLVTSVLPLGSTTQQWGSSDGGVTFSYNRNACELVRRLGEKLHLKKHLLARPEQDIELYGPIDFEIHKGKDDARYYALDVARLMPPTAPHGQVHAVLVPQDVSRPLVQVYVHEEAGSWLKDALDKIQASEDEACVEEHEDSCTIVVYKPEFTPRTSRASTTVRFSDRGEGSSKQNDRASHFTNIPTQGDAIVVKRYKNPYLYHYLRPEAVLSNPVPLNSEAFSPFRASTPEDDSEVREATSRIVQVEIPKLAAAIEQGEVIIVNSRQLVNELHKRGINLRYIGMLRSHLSEREHTVRSFILMEMISRTIKNVLRSRLREVKSLQEEAYHDVLTHFFNMVLGSSQDSDRYWQWSLKIHLLVKYSSHHIFSEEEAHTDHDLREHILSKLALFATMQKHLGVSYKQSTQERFQNDPTLFEQQSPFTPQDIAAVAVHVNTLPYHQRELALLTSEVMGLDDENKLAKEIELGKAMIEAEREIERRKKRRARGFVEGMEKEHEDERFAEPLPDLRLTAARAGPPAVPSVSVSVSVSASPSSPSGPSSSAGSGAVPMAPPVRDSERHRGDGVLRVQKFEHRGRQLSWSALRATDEPNNDFYFINKLSGEELVRLQNKRQALYSIVFGDKSLEAAIGLFKLAEAESRVESNTLALELVAKGCDILIARKECPVEIVVGFYYLRGTIYERTQQRYHALRVYLIALNVLEAVYGDARPQGVGMGHPFGLVLCCRLAKLAEEERLFAAAFRYGRRFELLWERFPLPSDNPDLLKFVFGSPDYLLSFGHFIQKHEAREALPSAPEPLTELSAEVAGRQDDSIKRATRSWLKQISLFDNWSDVNLSTTMLQHDIFARGQPFYLSKHLLTRNLLAKKRQKRRSRVVQEEALQLSDEAEAPGARRDRPMGRVGRHASIPEPLMRHEVGKGAHQEQSLGSRSESGTNNPDQHQQHPNGKSDLHLDISSLVRREAAADEQQHCHLDDDDYDDDEREGAPPGAKGGELWTWGMGRNGKYDRLTSNLREPRPLNLPDTQLQLSLSTITSVACSSSHALFTTRSGKVYTLGDKATGQVNGSTGATQLHAQPVQGLENHVAVKVACGIGSSLVLTREGRVFLWGSALTSSRDFGTMDLSMPDPNTPALLRSMARHCVVDVSCGGAHTLLVTSTGGLFSFGSGEAGALGHGFFTGDIRAPKQVMALSAVPVVAASAGEYFSLVLAADGAIYSFGRGDKGQLGHQKLKLTGYRSLTPRRVEGDLLNAKVVRIAAGHDHSMAVTDNGKLYLWGSNEHRKLGFRKKAAFPLPKLMKPKKFAAAAAAATTAVVDEEGLNASPVGEPRRVTHIAAGYSHSIAVVDEHDVFTWGSAAWAQLGHGDERQCKRPSLVKLLSGMGRVLQVSATYGQSMVLLHLHRHQRAPLAHDLHSPRTATVHRKVHVDLVAEAAPNLASIRTLLAAEIAQQVKSPQRGHTPPPSPAAAAGRGGAPSSEGAAHHQQPPPFFSRLSVRSRLARFRHRRRLRKAGGAAYEGDDDDEQEQEQEVEEGGLIYGTPARQRTASGARKYSTDDALDTTDEDEDDEDDEDEDEEAEEHIMLARLVSRGLQFEPESSGLTTDDEEEDEEDNDDDGEEDEAARSTGPLASLALEEQARRDSTTAAANEEARTGAAAAAAAAREEKKREERRQERRAQRARWQSDELSRRRKAGHHQQQPRGHHPEGGSAPRPPPPPLLEIEPCYLFRIPPAASNPLVSLQWSFQAGKAPFWIGRLRIYPGGRAAPPPSSSSSSSSTVAGVSSSAPSTLDLVLEDTATTFRRSSSSSSSSQQQPAAAAAAVLGSYTLDQTAGKACVPRVAPTNDSRRFFVLYLDPVRSEQWGQGAVGLGFAERIDAYEFEELLHGHARSRGESMLKRTVSRSEGAALPHHHHLQQHVLEKAISADGPLTRSNQAREPAAATAANPQATTAALRALPSLQQAQHQHPDEPLLSRHGRRQHFLQAAEFNAIPRSSSSSSGTPDEQAASPAGAANTTATRRGHARRTSDRKRKGLSLPPNTQGWVVKHL